MKFTSLSLTIFGYLKAHNICKYNMRYGVYWIFCRTQEIVELLCLLQVCRAGEDYKAADRDYNKRLRPKSRTRRRVAYIMCMSDRIVTHLNSIEYIS